MWRGQEDFIAVCSIYQINIKMITITGEEDENPVVNILNPILSYLSLVSFLLVKYQI